MTSPLTPFSLRHHDTDIRFGIRSIARLRDDLAARGLGRALIVCGTHVAANDDLMAAIRTAPSGRVAGVVRARHRRSWSPRCSRVSSRCAPAGPMSSSASAAAAASTSPGR